MIKNNARTRLATSLNSESYTFVVNTGEGALFPEENFEVFIENINEAGEVLKRESVFIERREADVFTIKNRGYFDCVQNDLANPKIRSKEYLNFSPGDFVSHYISEEFLIKIDEEINKRVEKNDNTYTQEGNEFNQANKLLKIDNDGKYPALDGGKILNVVKNSGNETISGKKKFSGLTNFEGGIAVSDRTDDFTGVLNSPNAIAIGDNDTGFLSPADGELEAYINGTKIFKAKENWIQFDKQVATTQSTPLWDHSLTTKKYVDDEIIKAKGTLGENRDNILLGGEYTAGENITSNKVRLGLGNKANFWALDSLSGSGFDFRNYETTTNGTTNSFKIRFGGKGILKKLVFNKTNSGVSRLRIQIFRNENFTDQLYNQEHNFNTGNTEININVNFSKEVTIKITRISDGYFRGLYSPDFNYDLKALNGKTIIPCGFVIDSNEDENKVYNLYKDSNLSKRYINDFFTQFLVQEGQKCKIIKFGFFSDENAENKVYEFNDNGILTIKLDFQSNERLNGKRFYGIKGKGIFVNLFSI